MKKIIYTIYKLSSYGGMERILTEKANYLSNYYDITIITVNNNGNSYTYPLDKSVKHIDMDIHYQDTLKQFILWRIINYIKLRLYHQKRLQTIVDEINPDILVTLGDKDTNLIPKINTKARIIWECHFNRFYIYYSNLYSDKPYWIKIVNYIRSAFQDYNASKYDNLIALTEEDSRQWKTKKCIVIPNFITGNITKQSALNNKIVVAVGRLEPQKGYDLLIDIWQMVYSKKPDWILNIYGEGSQEEALKKQIHNLQLDETVFLKGVTQDIGDVYANASIFLSASRYEGMPLVMLEAMSSGLPVISFDYKCGPKDILINNSGILITSYDTFEFSRAILHLIENDSIRKEIGKNARHESEKYTKEKIMNRWLPLFN